MPIILSGMKTPVHSPGMKVPLHSGHLHRPLLSGFICAPQFGHFGQRLLGMTSPPLQLCFSFRFVLWLSCLLYLKRSRRWENPLDLIDRRSCPREFLLSFLHVIVEVLPKSKHIGVANIFSHIYHHWLNLLPR